MVKRTSISGRRGSGLHVLAVGVFILTALVFVFLLYYGPTLAGLSKGVH